MKNRKQLIEEIMANLNAMKNKMQVKVMQQEKSNRITHSQWFVLCLINEHKNMGIKEVSNILGITSSAGTQLVDGLVKSGYVARKTNLNDRRSLQLGISQKGQKNIAALKKQHAKTMGILFKALSDNELKAYNKLHKKILTNINNS